MVNFLMIYVLNIHSSNIPFTKVTSHDDAVYYLILPFVLFVFYFSFYGSMKIVFNPTKFLFSLSHYRGIAKVGEPNNIAPLSTGMMNMDPAIHSTLRRKQRRLVRENPGVISALMKGANMAIQECQHQFRNRRWNCSTRNFLRGKNLFGKIVDRGKWK